MAAPRLIFETVEKMEEKELTLNRKKLEALPHSV